jgi:hypothetical protein
MSCGLPGRYDSAGVLAGERHDNEQHFGLSHSNDLGPLLVVNEPGIDFFDTVRVFEGSDGIPKIHAMLAEIHGGFAIVPFVLHTNQYRMPAAAASNPL